jgi:hypothetical protein
MENSQVQFLSKSSKSGQPKKNPVIYRGSSQNKQNLCICTNLKFLSIQFLDLLLPLKKEPPTDDQDMHALLPVHGDLRISSASVVITIKEPEDNPSQLQNSYSQILASPKNLAMQFSLPKNHYSS